MIGEDACPGVKQNGFPYLIRRSVECSCPGDAIPATIEVDISGLNLGQTVLLSQLKLPQNIKLVAKVLSTAKACLLLLCLCVISTACLRFTIVVISAHLTAMLCLAASATTSVQDCGQRDKRRLSDVIPAVLQSDVHPGGRIWCTCGYEPTSVIRQRNSSYALLACLLLARILTMQFTASYALIS